MRSTRNPALNLPPPCRLLLRAGPFAAALFLAFLTQASEPTRAQVVTWKLGGSGLPFDGSDTTRVMLQFDVRANSLAPRYFVPEENMFLSVTNWSELRNPFELDYVDGHQPRLWTGNGTSVNATSYFDGPQYVDGKRSTYNTARGGFWTFDIGVPVPATHFGFATPTEGFRSDGVPLSQDPVPAFEVSIAAESDPALQLGGYHRLENTIADVRENFDSEVDIAFPQQYVRFVRYNRNTSALDAQSVGGTIRGTIAEFILRGEGVPKRAVYVSKIIDLERPVNFGRIFWKATAFRQIDGVAVEVEDAEAYVEVTARAGVDDDPNIYHEYTDSGREFVVSRERYENELRRPDSIGQQATVNRRPGQQASITYDSENWGFWSPPITASGNRLELRNGSHLQLEIKLQSQAFHDYIRLDSLWIEQSPLLADRIVGEIAPLEDPQPANGFTQVDIGTRTRFTLDLNAEFADASQKGFDVLRLRSGNGARFVGLEMGNPLQAVEPLAFDESAEGLEIRLPQRVSNAANNPLRLVFATELLLYAATFQAEVADSAVETLPQPVQAGNANDAVGTNSLRVLGRRDRAQKLIQNVRVSAPIFTPNGDGANDVLRLDYELFLLPEPLPAELRLYGLDGTLLTTHDLGLQQAGAQQAAWDGRDSGGTLLAPGVYLLEIALRTQGRTVRHLRPIGLAY